MNRSELLGYLSSKILEIEKDSPILIGIDGIDASGKTTLADELAEYLKDSIEYDIIRASIDGFHNPEKIRYAKGKDSPQGYFYDSFNFPMVIDKLLNPLYSGNLEYKTRAFDHSTDSEVILSTQKANNNSILIMDGIFLLRPELINYWDLKIFLEVDFKVALQRNISRQLKEDPTFSEQKIIDRYNSRYMPGQKLYFKEVNPKDKSDIIVHNSNFESPTLVKG